ncbi:uncharacterized protein LOC131434750 [Malaya genurostris]|uniref:uncharacterized protein LOC131434750 n=1 Tax=Malaya genurostris TaxID=325434 RepID=UPI0026F3F3CD|nr:uncharacterized protein LOC131434750 [Malaya genurostris]
MESTNKYHDEIPKRLLGQLVLVERIAINRKHSVLAVIISTELRLLEVNQRAIITSIDLAQFLDTAEPTAPVSSIFGTSPLVPETGSNEGKEISLSIFRTYDGTERKLFYLISIDRKLVVLERNDQPSVNFVHFRTFDSYSRHEITGLKDNPGVPVVEIYLEHQTEPVVTDFQSYCVESNEEAENSFVCFHEIQKTLREQTNEKRAELATARSRTGELFDKLNDRLKQVPSLLRSENPDEKRPLVKYGDIWIKVHNEQLVVGIPIFNCTYKRRLTLTNLSLFLDNASKARLAYSCKFYQLDDDDILFKNYEQILAAEDIISDVPLFQQEWAVPKNNVLHPEQSAIFVATMELTSVLDQLETATTFECFVLYDVATLEANICDRLQLYLGALEVKRSDLFSDRCAVSFKDSRSIFKDLLSLTATSEFVAIEVSFEKAPDRGLDRFFIEALKFQSVLLTSAIHSQEILYYPDSGYWQGVLIRLDELNQSKQKIKIYGRYKHQIITLIQTIYSDYEERCSLMLAEDKNTTLEEFKDSIINELKVKIEKPLDIQQIASHELKTDSIYSKLALE